MLTHMLSFAVYQNGKPADRINLAGAYVIGNDDVALRAEVTAKNGVIQCKKRAAGPAGLVILWRVPDVGEILLETVRLMERKEPYVLQVELARGRLMRLSHKIEEWGLIDYEGTEALMQGANDAKELLIQALQSDAPAKAADLGGQALTQAVQISEAFSQFHAEVFFDRRKTTGGFTRRVFGCSVELDRPTELVSKRLAEAVDFVTVPTVWRDIEPNEQSFNWKPLDTWIEALAKQRIPIKCAPLLSFREQHVPDWLYIWEHDFDTIRDLAFEHMRRVINRYGQYVQMWDVISGIHANNCFTFNFEQLMEMTRMAAALTKQVASRSVVIIDLIAPWGEYYARNQRTIPPLLYADMAVQSGVSFDAFGLQFQFGGAADSQYVRDMFQISSIIDQFGKLGKPLHITAIQVPSSTKVSADPDRGGTKKKLDGGSWHAPWSERVQADWLERFLEVSLSKPFMESVSWLGLTDHKSLPSPHGGLLSSGFAPKAAYEKMREARAALHKSDKVS